MKRFLFPLFFILILFFCNIAGAEGLNNSTTLDGEHCYICGNFYEADPIEPIRILEPFIYMNIDNLDTNVSYDIPFNRQKQYCYYQLEPGHYKISYFYLRLYMKGPDPDSPGYTGANFKGQVKLSVNPDLLNEFELKAGESLYIGDYLATYLKKSMFFYIGDARTAKISLLNSYEKFSRWFEKKNTKAQLTLRTLDIKEITPQPADKSLSKKDKSLIAIRLLLGYGSRSKFRLILNNLSTNEIYEAKFTIYGERQYIEVVPGEYYVQTILFEPSFLSSYKGGGMDMLIPDTLLLPFRVNPKEILYIGEIDVEDLGNQVNSLYKYEFKDERPKISVDHGTDYPIRGLIEEN